MSSELESARAMVVNLELKLLDSEPMLLVTMASRKQMRQLCWDVQGSFIIDSLTVRAFSTDS